MEGSTSVEPKGGASGVESSKPKPCYFDHDGGFDDFVALAYLLKHQTRFDLLGVTVTPANSWWKAGTEATRKILAILDNHHCSSEALLSSASRSDGQPVPVAESTLPGKNHFPDEWRYFCCAINLLPQLNHFESPEEARRVTEEGPGISGEALLAKTLLSSETPVILIVTGPLSNLAWVLDNVPEASSKIDKVFIMGGALDVPGNVSVEGFDGSAEWNFFWDPSAAKRVWDSELELVLTSLDATNRLPITKDVTLRLCGQGRDSAHSTLVGNLWAMAGGHMLERGVPFFSWDLVTVIQLVHPELFTTSEVECDIVAEGPSQGRLVRCAGGDGVRRGRRVSMVQARDSERLYHTAVDELCFSA